MPVPTQQHSSTEALSAASTSAAATRRPSENADPFVLGLPLIVVGALALGLQLTGYVRTSSVGSPLALVIAASGFGLLFTAAWASRITAAPAASLWDAGKSLPVTILGVLSAFFLSYAALVLGLLHSWYGIRPADFQHTQALFQISWLVAFVLLAVSTIRLPVLFTVLFLAFSLVLVFLLIATLDPSQTAGKVGGWIALAIGAAAGYVFLSVSSIASGGPEYPLGSPLAGSRGAVRGDRSSALSTE